MQFRLEARTFDASKLIAEHPPRIRHGHKRWVKEQLSSPQGTVGYSRWAARPLPARVETPAPVLEVIPAAFDYRASGSAVWHVNFADPQLFVGYGTPLLAQDELQVLEHPVLGSLREALLAAKLPAVTEQNDEPTPVL